MTRKMYWGVAILILLIGTAAVFIIQHELAENRKLKDQLDDAQKLADEIEQRKISENDPSPEVSNTEQVQPTTNDNLQITGVPIEDAQQNDDFQSNKSHEHHLSSPLTSKELDELYQQMSAEISQMDSDEELERGLDLTQYTQRQLAHLSSVGINLSLLPEKLADKITAHQYRKEGLSPPTKGEIIISSVKRTPTGGMTFAGGGELLPGETADEFTERMIKAAEKKLSETEN